MIIETTAPTKRASFGGPQAASRPGGRPGVPGPSQNPKGKRRFFRTLLSAACWLYLVVLIAVWLTMRLTGDRWWIGTVLLMAPRWPFAVPVVGTWLWTAVSRSWRTAAASVLTTGVVLFLVMGFRFSIAGLRADRGELRLLSCNVHRQQFEPAELVAYIVEVKPDVIALQGWSESTREKVFGGGEWNVRTAGELLVASKYPIGKVTPLEITDGGNVSKGEQGVAALFELNTPRGPVRLINLHLASPHAGLLTFKQDAGDKLAGNIDRRWYESDRLLAFVEAGEGPLLMAGDFNTVDDSPIFREHWGSFADAFTERGTGLGYTYIIGHTQFRIDHILAGPTWQVVKCWIGKDIGTAHRPLMADLNVR